MLRPRHRPARADDMLSQNVIMISKKKKKKKNFYVENQGHCLLCCLRCSVACLLARRRRRPTTRVGRGGGAKHGQAVADGDEAVGIPRPVSLAIWVMRAVAELPVSEASTGASRGATVSSVMSARRRPWRLANASDCVAVRVLEPSNSELAAIDQLPVGLNGGSRADQRPAVEQVNNVAGHAGAGDQWRDDVGDIVALDAAGAGWLRVRPTGATGGWLLRNTSTPPSVASAGPPRTRLGSASHSEQACRLVVAPFMTGDRVSYSTASPGEAPAGALISSRWSHLARR